LKTVDKLYAYVLIYISCPVGEQSS